MILVNWVILEIHRNLIISSDYSDSGNSRESGYFLVISLILVDLVNLVYLVILVRLLNLLILVSLVLLASLAILVMLLVLVNWGVLLAFLRFQQI